MSLPTDDEALATKDAHHYYNVLADFADIVRGFGAVGVVHDMAVLFPNELRDVQLAIATREAITKKHGVLLGDK